MYRGNRHGAVVTLLLGALFWVCGGCGPTSTGYGNNNYGQNGNGGGLDAGTGGRDASQGGSDAWVYWDASHNVIGDAGCGNQTEEIELINLGDPPDVLIVLDRSGSMMMAPGFPPLGESKWSIMKNALKNLTASRDPNIRWGLTVFPTDEDCGVDPGARVEIADINAPDIALYLDSTSPGGNTPAHLALQEALAYYQTIPVNPEGRYVLFATDGIPNCGGNPPNVDIETNAETVQAVTDLANAGIPTYVLGFGDILGLDPGVLNDSALAGGVPRPGGPPHFYHADNATELQTVLDTIAGGVIVPSCTFELQDLPPVPDDVTVYFDGQPIPRSTQHTNGWDYYPDANHITLFGTYCDQLEGGNIGSVTFHYGCPGPQVD